MARQLSNQKRLAGDILPAANAASGRKKPAQKASAWTEPTATSPATAAIITPPPAKLRQSQARENATKDPKPRRRQISASRADRAKSRPFLVVGVGASAGGYEAFIQLLEHLPADTGMAFVLVQHLDPVHESQLSTLLSRTTTMKVTEILHPTPLAPNHIYVIPPNKRLLISQGVLQLSPRLKGGLHLPIDAFFQSLAHDQGNRAIGIVLSGNATDGTAGLEAIKAEGGITFAQDSQTARFPGMPQSAAAAGCVDFVLSPAAMARELARIAEHGSIKNTRAKTNEPVGPGSDEELRRLFTLLRASTGVDFSNYKLSTLKRRILRRMVLKKVENLKEYLDFLRLNPREVDLLFHDVLINVTGFFRDAGAFEALKKRIFPRILKVKPNNTSIRIWVPGCATGEEVYSLAICLHEFLGKNVNNHPIQIFGTDISEIMVTKARAGIFPRSIASHVSPERLRRYFQKYAGGYQISKFIRDVCVFARQNVVEDPPFSKLDLISCRNLLIYLGPPLQRKVMPIFHYSLRPQGFLMLGTSETIGSFSNLFMLIDKRNKIYTRTETSTRGDLQFLPAQVPVHEALHARKLTTESHPMDLQKRADEILLSQFTPPGVIVNSRLEVLHFRGKTGAFLEPAPGSASLNLLKMVRDELTVDLRTALMQASKKNEIVRKENNRIRFDGQFQDVTIEVIPFKNSPLPERFFLIQFRSVPTTAVETAKKTQSSSTRQKKAEMETQHLRHELAQTKDSLQTIIEEQEATNEELKSANEEIQSSNEELQSTNEELETAKEELQSTNEELTTLNEELHSRNLDLSQVNNDLNNLISSFNMPILMLGSDLTIRRFTPLAQKIFNLIPSDVGRRISDINPNIPLPDLSALALEVIDSLDMKEVEVQDREGHWYSLRIRPYRTSENKIEGAVIVLVDIGDIRQGLEEVTEIVPKPMLLLSQDLSVSKANRAFYEKFNVTPGETEGQIVFSLGNGQWNIPSLRTLLESVLPANKKVENYKVEHDFPNIGRRTFAFNARRLYQQSKGTHYVLVLLQDVTHAPGG